MSATTSRRIPEDMQSEELEEFFKGLREGDRSMEMFSEDFLALKDVPKSWESALIKALSVNTALTDDLSYELLCSELPLAAGTRWPGLNDVLKRLLAKKVSVRLLHVIWAHCKSREWAMDSELRQQLVQVMHSASFWQRLFWLVDSNIGELKSHCEPNKG